MAIGTAAAIGIGLAGAGTAAGAISSNKASKRAAQTSEQNNAANINLAREVYNRNEGNLSPFMQRGNAAGAQLNALLGLGGSFQGGPATMQMPMQSPNALSQFGGAGAPYGLGDGSMGPYSRPQAMPQGDFNAYLQANPDVMEGFNTTADRSTFSSPQQYAQWHYQNYGQNEGRTLPGATGTAAPAGQTAQQAAENAFDIFKNSTGYQSTFDSAMDGVASLYSGIGGLQSGAAIRGAQDRAADVAQGTFNNYAALLGGQQAVGAGAASSLAGVGQNFAGTVINANNLNSQNQMAAQLSRQNPLANFAGILGGGLFSYGMGGN